MLDSYQEVSSEPILQPCRIVAALDYISDTYPVISNPHLIIKDTYVIVIYSSLTATNFQGQAVSADIGDNFSISAFQSSHIKFNSHTGVPSASISLPPSLLQEASVTGDNNRIVLSFFLNDRLFAQRDSFVTANNLTYHRLGGLAVAAHIAGGVKVIDLKAAINMTFLINPVSYTCRTDNTSPTM